MNIWRKKIPNKQKKTKIQLTILKSIYWHRKQEGKLETLRSVNYWPKKKKKIP